MTTQTKVILSLVAAFVIAGAIYGAYQYPQVTKVVQQIGSPAGSTFNTAKVATIEWAPSILTGTTTSIFNSDTSDRTVESVKYSCTTLGTSKASETGAALLSLNFKAATTSSSNPAGQLGANTNYLFNSNVATTTPFQYVSSSTPGIATTAGTLDFVRVWPASGYITFLSNATNTATCLVGVSYLST